MDKVEVKTILNKHKKRDEWFLDDYSVNPYYGCSFNCIYCYVKGSKYGRKKLAVKINAPEVLDIELRRRARKGEYGIIALSSSTEPYMEVEREVEITKKLLKIILKYRFPVEVMTKSKLVLRDVDLLKEIDEKAILPPDLQLKHGVIVSFSFSILDEKMANIIEPKAAPPLERLAALQKCKEAGLFAGACFIPVLPFISDGEEQVNEMIKVVKEYGADFVFVGSLTLFGNANGCKALYYKFLHKHYPELLPKYEELYMGSFMPPIKYQRKLEKMAKRICEKYGIKYGIR